MPTNEELKERYALKLKEDPDFKLLFPTKNPNKISLETLEEIILSEIPLADPYWIEKLGPKRPYERNLYQKAFMLYPLAELGIEPKDLDYETVNNLVSGENPVKTLNRELSTLDKGKLMGIYAANKEITAKKSPRYRPRSSNPKTIGPSSRTRSPGSSYRTYRGSGGGESS